MSTTFGVSLENKTRLVEKKNWKRKSWIEKFCFPGGTTELPLPCIEKFLIQINFNRITENRLDGVPAFVLLALIMCVKCDYLLICACITTNCAGFFSSAGVQRGPVPI